MKLVFIGFLILLAGFSSSSHAASFDCSLAKLKTEKMICSDRVLSALDENLAAVYSSQSADKASQRAWLKTRDKCDTTTCLIDMYRQRIAMLTDQAKRVPPPSPSFNGLWKLVYSCADATGIYADRCKAGQQDYFEIRLWSDGNKLCGTHVATAQLGGKVDETDGTPTSITGQIQQNSATVTFHSAWGGNGKASITRVGDTLRWKVISRDDGQSWIPSEATLSYRASIATYKLKCPA
jgi:uncharacterized protein YecT (DUF1311 family)